jgi:hypothetical protein
MTHKQAKEILAVYRPGTDDERDPVFAEALELARTDAELKAWFDESVAFDKTMKSELARIIAPASVRDAILAEHKIIRPEPWWHRRMGSRQFAAAAAVIIAGLAFAFWYGQRPATFSEFRRELADQSWGPSPHIQLKATNMVQLRRVLAVNGLPARFTVPSALAKSEVRGCSLLQWRGHEVPVICFQSEGQHLHLMVVNRKLFPDAPTSGPQMDQWQVWRTASWSRDNFSYVLTGLSTPNFVKKFRKSKRWDWEG